MEKFRGLNVIVEFFSGERREYPLRDRQKDRDGRDICSCSFEKDGCHFKVTDLYEKKEKGIRIQRTVRGEWEAGMQEANTGREGIRIGFQMPIWGTEDGYWGLTDTGEEKRRWRFCVPSMVYTKPDTCENRQKRTFMEDRLTAPMVLAYCDDTGEYISFSKENPSEMVEPAVRKKGDSTYLHKTHNVSLGYIAGPKGRISFESFWPYGEADKSSALSSDERPAIAFYPMDGKNFAVKFLYWLERGQNDSFSKAVYEAYAQTADRMEEIGQKTVNLPFSKEESRQYRMHSLGKSYREFGEKGAGFFFHFDPLYGYDSRPSGFSTCYDTIPHNSYTHILEYGFTGRQINAAYIMAAEKRGQWIERGEKVIDFFLENCQLENGWVYSLYDLNTEAPFFSFGDPDAPKLHYISRTSKKGNYLRTMTEPMNDLLECYEWYKSQGREHKSWKEAFLKYADFLVSHQNGDGSWYRAYCPDGEGTDAIEMDKGEKEAADRKKSREEILKELQKGQKSVTSIPLVFLSNLCRVLKTEREDFQKYYDAAVRAGEYVLQDMVREEHYQGATLDNPNQVDKEASQYVMAGLCRLYLLTGEARYLEGAENAAFIFTTWNYNWNAPMQEGNILYEKGFRTKGMGAINSVWGGGVVDIYSLFHIRELFIIGKLRNHPLMCRMAEWIATATAQILSYPGDSMGFADIGMQPEGFGICPQGMDEGMIVKGGIWGTLGWIYSAGIYGIKNYLLQKEEMENE